MRKTIFIAVFFSLFCAVLGASFFQGGDYLTHYYKSKQGCESSFFVQNNSVAQCESYTPLFHWIAFPFTFNENAFFFFTIFLFVFLTPLIIYKYTNNWYSALIYFCASNYVWYFMDGIFPQALAQLFIFILFFTKDRRLEIVLIPLIILSHGSGFMAVLFVLFFKYVDLAGWLCSSVFGANQSTTPQVIYTKIGSSGGLDFQINNVLHFFTKLFPIPFLFMALKESSQNDKRTFGLLVFLIIAGFVYAPRVWYLAFILAIPSITKFFEKQPKKNKIYLLVFTILYGVFQVYTFYTYHTQCV